MKLRILGCSGGISPNQGTTAFLVDDALLIDAGTGVEALSHDEMFSIRHVVLTHSHLDHICHLPFLLNNLIGETDKAIDVYGTEHTIRALKEHVFNDVVWPDFTLLPNPENPSVKLHVIEVGETLNLDGKKVVSLPAEHAVPTVGYWVGDEESAFAFSGDCSQNDALWEALKALPEVDMLIVDNQYMESEKEISRLAKHYHPSLLLQDVNKLPYQPHLFITHLPPYKKSEVMDEIQHMMPEWRPQALMTGHTYSLPLDD